jgi:hypothetical protein
VGYVQKDRRTYRARFTDLTSTCSDRSDGVGGVGVLERRRPPPVSVELSDAPLQEGAACSVGELSVPRSATYVRDLGHCRPRASESNPGADGPRDQRDPRSLWPSLPELDEAISPWVQTPESNRWPQARALMGLRAVELTTRCASRRFRVHLRSPGCRAIGAPESRLPGCSVHVPESRVHSSDSVC